MTVARSTLLIETPQVAIPLGMFPLGPCPDEKLDHFVANDHLPNCFGTNVRALFMTVWRLSTRSAENSCGIRQS